VAFSCANDEDSSCVQAAASISDDRPPSAPIEDAFSLLQTKIEVSSVVVHREDSQAKPVESVSKGTGILWLDSTLEKLKLSSWEIRQWITFLVCLLMLEYVVYKATVTKVLKPEDLEKLTRWKKARTPEARPNRLCLSVPLRQLLDKTVAAVQLLRSTDDSPAFLATLSEDAASGDRTVQVRDAAKPTEALISVGPLARSNSVEDCSAVYRHGAGHTIGALKAEGPGSWSVCKNGQQSLQISSSAPGTLAISTSGGGTMNAMRACHFNEVAWVRPPLAEQQAQKISESVELSICEDFDSALAVACALAVLVTSECSTIDDPKH